MGMENPPESGFLLFLTNKRGLMNALKHEDKKSLTHRIHTRITKEKYDELTAILARSINVHSHSELLRNILDNEKIKVETYDTSFDKFIEEISLVRKEVQAIGININQVARHFHREDAAEAKVALAIEICECYRQADQKITQLLTLISKISETWFAK